MVKQENTRKLLSGGNYMNCRNLISEVLKNILLASCMRLFINLRISEGARKKPMITKMAALTIANKEAVRLGYRPHRFTDAELRSFFERGFFTRWFWGPLKVITST